MPRGTKQTLHPEQSLYKHPGSNKRSLQVHHQNRAKKRAKGQRKHRGEVTSQRRQSRSVAEEPPEGPILPCPGSCLSACSCTVVLPPCCPGTILIPCEIIVEPGTRLHPFQLEHPRAKDRLFQSLLLTPPFPETGFLSPALPESSALNGTESSVSTGRGGGGRHDTPPTVPAAPRRLGTSNAADLLPAALQPPAPAAAPRSPQPPLPPPPSRSAGPVPSVPGPRTCKARHRCPARLRNLRTAAPRLRR